MHRNGSEPSPGGDNHKPWLNTWPFNTRALQHPGPSNLASSTLGPSTLRHGTAPSPSAVSLALQGKRALRTLLLCHKPLQCWLTHRERSGTVSVAITPPKEGEDAQGILPDRRAGR